MDLRKCDNPSKMGAYEAKSASEGANYLLHLRFFIQLYQLAVLFS